MTRSDLRRSLYLMACLAVAWALIAMIWGGVVVSWGPLRFASRDPLRPLLVGLAAAACYVWRVPRSAADVDGQWLTSLFTRSTRVAVPILVIATLGVGILCGSFAAGGSDSYGYISQARLWLAGELRIEQPWVDQMSWPYREWTFAPLGYRPVRSTSTLVPTYPAGLPILMAGFERLFGPNGPFLVVPLIGALAVWLTYALGREASRHRSVGALAALLLVTSPVFLAHVMLPMTDVPVAAGWTLVCVLALREPPRALAAGLAAGATLLVRPNLLLLILVPLAAWIWPCVRRRGHWRLAMRDAAFYSAGMIPGLIAIAAINTHLYGSPFVMGYGGPGDVFSPTVALANLRNYGGWLMQSQTPLVALSLVPFVLRGSLREGEPRASARAAFTCALLMVLLSYVFYGPFDVWFYLRFLLPSFPVLFVLTAAGVRSIVTRLPVSLRAPIAGLVCLACIAYCLKFAHDQGIFNQRAFERRYVEVGEYIANHTPVNAVIVCVQHSGSIRYYSKRITLRYDWLPLHRLDPIIDELKMKGYRPYILLEEWEEPGFRARFGPLNSAGRLDWQPMAEIAGSIRVRLYNPDDRATAPR